MDVGRFMVVTKGLRAGGLLSVIAHDGGSTAPSCDRLRVTSLEDVAAELLDLAESVGAAARRSQRSSS
jgi:hypothetical protein